MAAGGPSVLPWVKVGAGNRELYQVRGGGPSDYYEMESGPVLKRLRRTGPDRWQELQTWDFSSLLPEPGAEREGFSSPQIYPALYPAGPGFWAVALVVGSNEMYSGGGARFEWADFVLLGDPEKEEIQPLFQKVPFSCSKMIRACFTEKEYARSKHCTDDSRGWLTLRFAPSKRSGRYDWILTWHEWEWPSDTFESQATTRQTTIRLGAGDPPEIQERKLEHLPFCGGAQSEP
jgi:hypothetical protein